MLIQNNSPQGPINSEHLKFLLLSYGIKFRGIFFSRVLNLNRGELVRIRYLKLSLRQGGGGLLLGILAVGGGGGGVRYGFLNPDPMSDQNMKFSGTLFYVELASKIRIHFQTWFLVSIPISVKSISVSDLKWYYDQNFTSPFLFSF